MRSRVRSHTHHAAFTPRRTLAPSTTAMTWLGIQGVHTHLSPSCVPLPYATSHGLVNLTPPLKPTNHDQEISTFAISGSCIQHQRPRSRCHAIDIPYRSTHISSIAISIAPSARVNGDHPRRRRVTRTVPSAARESSTPRTTARCGRRTRRRERTTRFLTHISTRTRAPRDARAPNQTRVTVGFARRI
jgi:hypothetical protein